MSPKLPRPSLDGMLNLVDVDALLEHIDLNRQLERVDLDALLERVDINQLLERVDIDALLERVDVNRIVSRVDVEDLVQRTELGALIAESTSGVAQRVLDTLRAQAVGLDGFSNRIMNKLFRRDSATMRPGPPNFHTALEA